VGPITTTVTTTILEKSHINNKKANITGILCQGAGLWMQALEGERSQVNSLYSRIMADRKQQNLEILSMKEINQRQFGQWSMALVSLDKDDPMVQMAHPEFDPYSASADAAIALLDQLIKSSSPITIMGA
jgi:hypothetical protein